MNIPKKEIIEAIRSAGKIVLSAHDIESNKNNIHEKPGSANFVTVFDVRVQNFLIEKLSRLMPEAIFLAEEKDNANLSTDKGFMFCIDPIDGTTNFIHDYRMSSISVGLIYNNETVFGAVLNPYSDELFFAERGCGAFLNDCPIQVSTHDLPNALIGFGSSPYYKNELSDQTFKIIKRCFLEGVDIRRSGSAALDLCYVASGRIDCFFECILSPWDYAAGSLIIQEAGGIITDFDGNPVSLNKPCGIIASNHLIYTDFKRLIESEKDN